MATSAMLYVQVPNTTTTADWERWRRLDTGADHRAAKAARWWTSTLKGALVSVLQGGLPSLTNSGPL